MDIKPGDLLCTRSTGFGGTMIRLGAALRGRPNLANHVAIVHHVDKQGTCWVLEGRPGGVGWRQANDYVASKWTMSNVGQPKTGAQRQQICAGALAMIGTQYDWTAIAADAADVVPGLGDLWNPRWDQAEQHGTAGSGVVPGHVVCSSLAAYLYDKVGLEGPKGRAVTPGDWSEFIIEHGWQTAAPAKVKPVL